LIYFFRKDLDEKQLFEAIEEVKVPPHILKHIHQLEDERKKKEKGHDLTKESITITPDKQV